MSRRADKLDGSRGRLHAQGRSNKQRVTEQLPQPIKRMTCCGSAQSDALTGAAHVLFLDQSIEDNEQIQVDRSELHLASLLGAPLGRRLRFTRLRLVETFRSSSSSTAFRLR